MSTTTDLNHRKYENYNILNSHVSLIENQEVNTQAESEKITAEANSSDQPYLLYKTRFVVAATVALGLLLNAEMWISLSTIPIQAKRHYGVESDSIMEWLSTIFLLSMAVTALPSLFIPQLLGLRRCILGGLACNFLGSALRLISFSFPRTDSSTSHWSFGICLTGNLIASFAQGFLLNIPSLVSTIWFGDLGRISSTIWMMNGSILGTALGFILNPLLVGSDELDLARNTKGLFILGCIEISICWITLVTGLIFVKSSPPTPPSKAATIIESTAMKLKLSLETLRIMGTHLKQLLTSKKYLLLLLTNAVYYAASTAFYVRLGYFAETTLKLSKGFLLSYTAPLAIFAGALLGYFFAYMLGNHWTKNRHQRVGWVIMLLSAAPLLIMLILAKTGHSSSVSSAVLVIIFGMMAAPYMAIGYEVLSNVAFPIPDNVAVTLALIAANILSTANLQLFGLVQNPETSFMVFMVTTVLLYVAIAVVTMVLKVENNKPISSE